MERENFVEIRQQDSEACSNDTETEQRLERITDTLSEIIDRFGELVFEDASTHVAVIGEEEADVAHRMFTVLFNSHGFNPDRFNACTDAEKNGFTWTVRINNQEGGAVARYGLLRSYDECGQGRVVYLSNDGDYLYVEQADANQRPLLDAMLKDMCVDEDGLKTIAHAFTKANRKEKPYI